MEFTKKNGKRRVVITGAGMISGLGQTWEEAYEQLKSYKNCIKDMEEWHDIQGMNTHLACPAKRDFQNIQENSCVGWVVLVCFLILRPNRH